MFDSLQPNEPEHTGPPCPSLTPRVYSNSCPSSQWCHPAISSSVVPFSSCPQSLPASQSFPMSQPFAGGGQSIEVSALASVIPKNIQDWSPLERTGWISLQSKGLSRSLLSFHYFAISNNAIRKNFVRIQFCISGSGSISSDILIPRSRARGKCMYNYMCV